MEPGWVVFSILQIYNRVSVMFFSPDLFVLKIRGEIEQVGRELEPGGGGRRSSGSTDLTLQFTLPFLMYQYFHVFTYSKAFHSFFSYC